MTSNLNEFSIGTSATFYNLSGHQPGRHKKIKEKKIQISIYQKKGLTDPSKDNDLKSQIFIYQKKGLTDPSKDNDLKSQISIYQKKGLTDPSVDNDLKSQ